MIDYGLDKWKSRHKQEKQSFWMLKPKTQLKISKQKFKIKKEFAVKSKIYFSLENNLKMEELYLTIIFRKNQFFT
jgi:hypothetical protein